MSNAWNIDRISITIACILNINLQESLFSQYLLLKFRYRSNLG